MSKNDKKGPAALGAPISEHQLARARDAERRMKGNKEWLGNLVSEYEAEFGPGSISVEPEKIVVGEKPSIDN